MPATTTAPAWRWAAARCTAASDGRTRSHQRNRGRAAMLCPALLLAKRLSDQLCEQVGVDIAAGEHDDDVLALGVDAACEQHGEADGAAGLDHQLQLAIGK